MIYGVASICPSQHRLVRGGVIADKLLLIRCIENSNAYLGMMQYAGESYYTTKH